MSTLMLCFFVSCIVSCSTKTEFVNKTNNDLPEWFNSTEELSGIGIASPSRGGLKYQLAQAELNAKGNLASKIDSEISRVSKNALRSARINEGDDIEDFFAQATKEVVNNLPLRGASRIKTYIAKDGTLYVMVVMNKESYLNSLKDSKESMLATLRAKNLARDSINKSEEATKAIFEELEKETK